jgi:hypothetical protein
MGSSARAEIYSTVVAQAVRTTRCAKTRADSNLKTPR